MKTLSLIYSAVIFAFLPLSAEAEESAFPLRDAVECTPRSGLPNLRAKIEAGKTVKIAYLGGSITAAGGWRVQSRKWLAAQYPDATFEEIHAAIGGTGSDLGVFRLRNDVLRHEPDLLFVEFAVNDGGAPPERIHKAMEGIVRQTWKANAGTDICFVYTLRDNMVEDLKSGKMPRAASAMEVLADHYRIPSIHFGVEVEKQINAGKLIFKGTKEQAKESDPVVFSTDGVHPLTETGHRIYTETIAKCWPLLWKAGSKPAPHELPDPYRHDNWEAAKQIPITEAMLKGDWEKLTSESPLAKRFQRNMPQLFRANSPGASLSFTLNGTTASVFDLVGPTGGEIEIRIDEGDPVKVKRIDGYCTYPRMSQTRVLTEAQSGTYEVTISLAGDTLDKRPILFERNREDFDKTPEKYDDHFWHASSLLIIGELSK